jgi:hypothetical protein
VVQPTCLPDVAWGNKYQVYEAALRLCPSKTLREFLIAEADFWVWQSPADALNYQCTTVCFAYELTGDPVYAAYCKHLLETSHAAFAKQLRNGERMDFQALSHGGFITRLMRTVADAMNQDAAGLEAAVEDWRKRRQELPERLVADRPDRGPTTNLGPLSVEPHSL